MKIAITGHTAGIGKAFAERLSRQGHTIIGISKRDGHNIRNIPKITQMIEPADMWINNAQAGYAQTELLYQLWEHWRGQDKSIWIISTMLTTLASLPNLPQMNQTEMLKYINQKRALEDAFYQLKVLSAAPKMLLIRPGAVVTQPNQVADVDGADVHKWVDTVIECFQLSKQKNLYMEELSLGFSKSSIGDTNAQSAGL